VPTEVRRNDERQRYELLLDGLVVGIADFHGDGYTLTFPHTVIDDDLRGNGYGAELVRGALDDVRARGKRVIPRCWYVAQFIDENPDYAVLLADAA
jgi:predicted GNAT family acetyltransferase